MICEQLHSIDVGKIAKYGLFAPRIFNPKTGKNEQISVDSTPCHLGGSRDWFLCPECERRCAILYANNGYACRKCHGLRYLVELEGLQNRAIRRCIRFRQRFGMKEGGTVAPFPAKPKLMRWHTYLKARQTDRKLQDRAFNLTAQIMRLGK